MSDRLADVPYDEVDAALSEVNAVVNAAESHGALVGMLVGPTDPGEAKWIAHVLQDTAPSGEEARNCLARLHQLYKHTRQTMDGDANGVYLLLPGDEQTLSERLRGLTSWCEGFLFGLGMAELKDVTALSAEAREALHDFGEIMQVEVNDVEGSEEDERAYTELVEFIRTAVLILLEENRPVRRRPPTEKLH